MKNLLTIEKFRERIDEGRYFSNSSLDDYSEEIETLAGEENVPESVASRMESLAGSIYSEGDDLENKISELESEKEEIEKEVETLRGLKEEKEEELEEKSKKIEELEEELDKATTELNDTKIELSVFTEVLERFSKGSNYPSSDREETLSAILDILVDLFDNPIKVREALDGLRPYERERFKKYIHPQITDVILGGGSGLLKRLGD